MVTLSPKSSEVKTINLVAHLYLDILRKKGNLAERFGAKWIFGGGIFIAGILTLLTPLAARVHVGLLIVIRILIGAFEVSQD